MLGLNSYLELSLFIDLIASICIGVIFLLIKIPHTEYSRSLYWSKTYITAFFGVCAVMFWFMLYHRDLEGWSDFVTIMMLVTTAVSAATLSYSLINLLDEKFMSRDSFLLNVILVAGTGIALARVMIHGYVLATKILIIIFIVGHVAQCIYHILRFNSIFTKSLHKMEEYYDEEVYHRIRWIRFCYIIMMLTDMFILVYVLFYYIFQKDSIMVAYILFYALFMLYFASNYFSFLGSHKLVFDAFAHEVLGGKTRKPVRKEKQKKNKESEEKTVAAETVARDKSLETISKALDRWVAEKRYREYDRSREEIADEIGTTKEMLQYYFVTKMDKDFRTWRTELRIEDAKALLLEDKSTSINMIADLSGFSDRSNFHRQFTKIVGCSPKEWRDSNGNPAK